MTRAALLAFAGLMLAGAAHAQAPAPSPAPQADAPHERGGGMRMMREACAADMKTFCGDVGEDRGARRQCMMAKQSKFSPSCQDAIAKMRAWREAHPRPDAGGPQ